MASSEVAKLQQHLALLKEEYTKLQAHCTEVEKKYNLAAASAGDLSETSFIARLLMTVSTLYNRELYSDISIKLQSKTIPAHKFVLNARSDDFNEEALKNVKELDWTSMSDNVGEGMLRWIYTDIVEFSQGDVFATQLMKFAATHKLVGLVRKCEKALISIVNVRTCVKFYSAADEINATALKDHCSSLISAHWEDLTGEDFAHMSSALLYRMLKSKTSEPLHAAVRLLREDVVFLCLVENNATLSETVNKVSARDELPLELALKAQATGIARTLLQHSALPDGGLQQRGASPLHRAAMAGDTFTADFLVDNGADVNLLTKDNSDSVLHLIAGLNASSHDEKTLIEIAKIAEKIIAKGINVNNQNKNGFTPLHLAVLNKNDKIFSLLIAHEKVDTDVRTLQDEHSALFYSLVDEKNCNILNGHDVFASSSIEISNPFDDQSPTKSDNNVADVLNFGFATKLIEKGCQLNPVYASTWDNLLILLAKKKCEESALFLCKHIVGSMDHINSEGLTALHVACLEGLENLTKSLLEKDANPNLQTSYGEKPNCVYRQTPIHFAVLKNHEGPILAIIERKLYLNANSAKANEGNGILVPNFNLKNSDGDTPLSLALELGHLSLVVSLIKGGADVNARNGKGFTLLHQAILKEDSKTAIFLLDHGADMNALTEVGETPLQLAIHCRLGLLVEGMCIRGIDMGRLDQHGIPPLWAALDSSQEEVASILVRNGADADCWGPGPEGCLQTLLHKAIDENKESLAQFLIRSGCDVESPRRIGPSGQGADMVSDQQTPLHLCCAWGLMNVIQTLIEHGANVNARDSDGKTPLHIAIENQHPEIISLLLSQPSNDLTLRDKQGLSPFATALTVRNNKAAQSILDRLPTAAEQVDTKGRNFLHLAIQKKDVESVMFLLSVEVDVNSRVQDAALTPPLLLAAAVGDEILLRSLLLAGARPNDRDAHKQSALHVASKEGHASIVSALLQNGADFDAVDSNGDNALHIAAREGHIAVARALLTESELNAEAINLKGRNPLHELCRCGKENAAAICELFLECMKDYPVDKTDLQGNSPLLLAYMRGQGALCRVLVNAKARLATENKDGVTIFNYQVATKQLLHRLLDALPAEALWVDSDLCQECGTKFTITMRKHHCRHCGRTLCSKCSSQDVPILKFNQTKPVRVCTICFTVLQVGPR
ncbi:rabankyrin-5 [Arctopsyche grandis]|uniref:rabankyrin-5 n=1 Tax=Arctopsyche grandis TaxID=121162 RepID=UPI00406D823D